MAPIDVAHPEELPMKAGAFCTEKNAKRAKAYRRAAQGCERLECDYTLSCRAIANAAYGHSWSDRQWDSMVNPYITLMAPHGEYSIQFPSWLKDADLDGVPTNDWRVLALCFMAAMVEAGDA